MKKMIMALCFASCFTGLASDQSTGCRKRNIGNKTVEIKPVAVHECDNKPLPLSHIHFARLIFCGQMPPHAQRPENKTA